MKEPGELAGLEAWALGFTMITAIGSTYFKNAEMTLGIIAGGAIMTANMWVIRRVVKGLIEGAIEEAAAGENKKKNSGIIAQYVLKILVFVIVIAILAKWGGVDPAGLIIGLTVSLAALITVGLKSAGKEDM